MNPAVLGVMIPIIAIILGVATAIVAIVSGHRQRMQRVELRHRERLAAIEKGLEIPADPIETEPEPRRPRYLLRGLCWLFVGVALTAGLYQIEANVPYLFGLVPAALGAGYLLFYFIEGRREAKAEAALNAAQSPPGN